MTGQTVFESGDLCGGCWLEGGVFVLLEAQIDTDIVFVKGRNYGLFHWGSCFACNRMVPFSRC